ncbi:MAG: glycosyltransferase N-terminal domain-containing protein [Spirosomataceae bacterium]
MSFFYTIGIYGYSFLLKIAAIFSKKAKLWVSGRRGWQQKLSEVQATGRQPVVWFHCASLGEFEQGRPVIEAFKTQNPHAKILLTFFSPSGYEVRKNYAHADWVWYLPADTPVNAQAFVEGVRPSLVFFVKYEFWNFYLKTLASQQIPIYLISGIFRPNQVFFKWYGGFYRGILRCFSHLFVQNETSQVLLQSVGIQQVTVAGDTRFDRVKQIADAKRSIDLVQQFKGNQPIFIVGSCWHQDFEVVLPLMNASETKQIKFIIAPHEIHPAEITNWMQQIRRPCQRFSAFRVGDESAEVLIIDNIGMLSSLYQYAEFAWIGGAYGKGLHNVLEAATFGMPLFFGNKSYQRFQEANDLLKTGSAFAISNASELMATFKTLQENELLRKQLGERSAAYVREKTGATQLILAAIQSTKKT